MSPVQLPRVCGLCGTAKANDTWNIASKVKKVSAVSALTLVAGVMVSNVSVYQFPVALCENCKKRLERHIHWKRNITLVGAFIAAASLVALMIVKDNGFEVFGILFLLSLGFVWIARMILTYNLGNFDGEYFQFKKRRYHDEFAILNPQLVKPTRK